MKLRQIFMTFACLLVAACSATVRPSDRTPASTLEPAETLGDTALIELVAKDFANSADCSDGLGKAGMIVNSYAASARGMVSDEWLHSRMDPEVWAKARSLTSRLRERNTSWQRMDWSFPAAQDIQVEDLSNVRGYLAYIDISKNVRCVTSFLLPAISTDGNEALVALKIYSDHGAIAFYVLRRERGEWQIDSHAFFAFI